MGLTVVPVWLCLCFPDSVSLLTVWMLSSVNRPGLFACFSIGLLCPDYVVPVNKEGVTAQSKLEIVSDTSLSSECLTAGASKVHLRT